MTYQYSAVGVALTLLIGTIAGAESDPPKFDSPGVYIGGSAVFGWGTLADLSPIDSSGVADDVAFGGSIWGGYRAGPRGGAELQIEYLHDVIADNGASGRVRPLSITANVKTYILTGRFQPFTIMGLGGGYVQAKDSAAVDEDWGAFSLRAGCGIEIYANEKLSFVAGLSYVYLVSGLKDVVRIDSNGNPKESLDRYHVGYLSTQVGMQYRF